MSSPAKHRLLRLVIGVTVLLVVVTFSLVVNSPPFRQAQAVAAIRRGHGPPSIGADSSRVPRWLRQLGTWEYFAEIYHVNCSLKRQKRLRPPELPPVTPYDDVSLQLLIPELGRLPDLERLTLCDTAITDDGLQGLSSLAGLRSLDLSGTAISDAAIPTLAAIPSLEQVDVSDTKVTVVGREALQKERPGVAILTFDYAETVAPRLP